MSSAGMDVPRLLSPAEEWFLWRQCAAEATGELELVNRGALAEALRRASATAADYGINTRGASGQKTYGAGSTRAIASLGGATALVLGGAAGGAVGNTGMALAGGACGNALVPGCTVGNGDGTA